jgi:hypothetical protein
MLRHELDERTERYSLVRCAAAVTQAWTFQGDRAKQGSEGEGMMSLRAECLATGMTTGTTADKGGGLLLQIVAEMLSCSQICMLSRSLVSSARLVGGCSGDQRQAGRGQRFAQGRERDLHKVRPLIGIAIAKRQVVVTRAVDVADWNIVIRCEDGMGRGFMWVAIPASSRERRKWDRLYLATRVRSRYSAAIATAATLLGARVIGDG